MSNLVELGEVIEIFDSRRVPLSSIERQQRPGPYPYYGAAKIFDYIDDFIFEGNFILVGEDGSVVREDGTPFIQYASGRFWANNHTHVIRPREGQIDFWYLISALELTDISGFVTGAAQPKLTQANLKRIPIAFPTAEVQTKIGALARTMYLMIDNNLRRIVILEQMAQAIYREWFVNFRFPGHEDVELIDSEDGLIPKGWEISTLGEDAEIVMGQSPKSEFYNETGDGLPFHQGVGTFGARFPATDRYTTVTNRVAEENDVLFSVRAPVGRINVANERLVVGRGLGAIRSRRGNPWFLLQQLRETFKDEDTMGGGTIFKAVTKADVYGIPYLRPAEDTEHAFESIVDPIARLIKNLDSQNHSLRTARDFLFPRLVSGKIDVSDLDIDTSWLAA